MSIKPDYPPVPTDKNVEHSKNVPPFVKFVCANVPMVFDDSLSYYEALSALWKWMQTELTDVVNNNANVTNQYIELTLELNEYIHDYFDNLDVQQEINNKLDAMAQDGTLTNLIKAYVDPFIESQNEVINNFKADVTAEIDSQNVKINAINASPLVASSTSGMTDTTRVYVNTTDGKWYYYDGDSWEIGGTYQSTGLEANEVELYNLTQNIEENYKYVTVWVHGGFNNSGAINYNTTSIRFRKMAYLEAGTVLKFTGADSYKYAVQSYSTTSASSAVANSGWLTNGTYRLNSSYFYLIMIAKQDGSTISSDDIETISQTITVYRTKEYQPNKLINFFCSQNPFSITEKTGSGGTGSGSYLHIVNEAIVSNKYWIGFSNNIEYYNATDWATTYKYGSCKLNFDITSYGTVTTANGVIGFDIILPTNYAIVLDVNTNTVKVKQYGDIDFSDALLLRNAGGVATCGAFRDIYDFWTNRQNSVSITTMSGQISDLQTAIANANPDYDKIVKAVAHRGYSSVAPENTLPAYQLAKLRGFNYVETDVSFTSDGVAVCLHDSTIDRTSNGSGSIDELTYEQVLQYDFGSWKSSVYAGTKIPTVEEFVKLCRDLGLHAYIELKNFTTYTQAQIESIVDIVNKNGMKGNVTYISASADYLTYVKNYDSEARLGYVCGTVYNSTITTLNTLKTSSNEVFVDIDYNGLTETVIDKCINASFPIEVWTVDSEETIESLDYYVTGVTSNSLIAGKVLYEANIGD